MAYDSLVDGSQLNSDLTSIANAIRTKTGNDQQLVFPVDFVNAIDSISGGTSEVEESAVNFIDYDGTVLYSYSASEIAELTELPANPTREGLIAQGWNSSLATIKSYMLENPDAIIDVGQMYTTDDGNTRLYIKLDNPNSLDFFVNKVCISNAEINWGDGTSTFTENVSESTISHTYASVGIYKITIIALTNFAFIGTLSLGPNAGSFLKTPYRLDNSDKVIKVEIGNNINDIPSGFFSYARSLKSITIPNTIESISAGAFALCSSLNAIVFPKYSVNNINTDIGLSAFYNCSYLKRISFSLDMPFVVRQSQIFYNCYSLRHIALPASISVASTSVNYYLFGYCKNINKLIIPNGTTLIPRSIFLENDYLMSITIPSSVTMIYERALYGCTALINIFMKSETPPTLGSTNAIPVSTSTRIYVPYSSDHSVLYSYQRATNWSALASYMVELPQQ